MMKALVYEKYGGPEVLKMMDFPKPTITKPTQVLVKVTAAGTHFAECIVRSGKVSLLLWLTLPKIPGIDYAGDVEEVGSQVKDFKVGDHVYGELASFTKQTGTYCEYVVVDTATDAIMIRPESITPAEASTFGIGALTANSGIEDADLHEGERILVIGGSGSVGGFAVQLAKVKGAHVTATCSAAKMDMVKNRFGADVVLDYNSPTFWEDVKNNGKYDVVFDSIGGDVYYYGVQPYLTGKKLFITAVGHEYQGGGYDKVFIWYAIKMVATMLWRGKKYHQIMDTKLKQYPKLNQLLIEGKIKPLETKSLPLAEGHVAHKDIDSRHPVAKYALIP